ncbi:MAG: cysteine--tRNA ligase [Microcoleaceae cyanobacterium]
MVLKVYNTQTRQKEEFTPLEPGKVKMYCCGVTVYDYCHLGHARSYIVWDTVRRYLEWLDYSVQYVQNFTDIDDKILNRAKKEGVTMQDISEKYINAYFEDIRSLNVQDADAYPRATDNISEIYQIIQQLETSGFAYAVSGDVFYQVNQFKDYGKLSGRKLDEQQAGASGRVDTEATKKKNSADFALWKAAKPDEPFWESPWGKGRPGWHIECSAMVKQILGNTIDIHCGGGDLIFPHHENEIAQSEAANCQPLSRYWMHNGMVRISGEKMSKSLGNFTTIRDLLETVNPMVIRLFILQAHYRKPLDFTDEAISSAANGWATLNDGLLFASQYSEKLGWQTDNTHCNKIAIEQFNTAMDDDFNTPGGLAVLFELAKELQKEKNILVHGGEITTTSEKLQQAWNTLVKLADVLGLEMQAEAEVSTEGMSESEIEALIQQRKQAKQAKNYAESDRIRDELKAAGIALIDKPGGNTIWHREG